MAPRIQLLPAALADQIAAGEVVERPASVVKELVENALDAGARKVEVEIERGGLGLIVVSDDGHGMTPEEAHLALRRHATSKLRSADELFALATFGFRGEALPSIASVAELTLITRRPEDTAGYEIVVRAGEVVSAREVGAPPGTRITARGLFGNVPARLKFQKATSTEAGHVVESLLRTAVGAPDVHVRLRVDGRSVIDLPPHPTLTERAHAIVRRSAGKQVRLASAQVTEGNVAVEVHLAPPDEAVQTARRVHLLVNRRVVRDRGLLSALQIGLDGRLPPGRHPLAVLSLTLPLADVDVNVHPQKLEVRLARPAEVHATVRHAVRRAAESAAWDRVEPPSLVSSPPTSVEYDAAPPAPLVARESVPSVLSFERPAEQFELLDATDALAVEHGAERGRAFELVSQMADGEAPYLPELVERAAPRYVGAVAGGYLAFHDARGLWLLDQHVASALCLLAAPHDPAPLERAIPVSPAFAELASELAPLGVVVDRAGVRALPAVDDPAAVVRELEAAFTDGGVDEVRGRLIGLLALSPAASVHADVAEGLLGTLLELHEELSIVAEQRFRGRRALLFVGRAEIGRRLES